MAFIMNEARARAAAAVGAVKYGIVLVAQIRRALKGHGAADIGVGLVYFLLRETDGLQNIGAGF